MKNIFINYKSRFIEICGLGKKVKLIVRLFGIGRLVVVAVRSQSNKIYGGMQLTYRREDLVESYLR
ncbi:MAG: hypothetical protein ACOCV1_05015, partial [Bacillota bacterium]